MTETTYGVPADPSAVTATDPAADSANESLFDDFLEQAQGEIYKEVMFPIERGTRPMYAKFVAVIGMDAVKRYRKSAMGQKKKTEDMDMIVANGMALVEKNIGLYIDGTDEEHLITKGGAPLTFKSSAFLDTYPDRVSAVDALRKFLGDAQLTSMGESLYRAAGYGADLEPVDPTDG